MSPDRQDQDDEAPPGTESISIEQVLTDDDRQRIDEAHEEADEDEDPDRIAIMGRNIAERSF